MQIKSIRGRYFAILRRPDGGSHRIRLGTRDEAEAHLIAEQGKLQEMEHAAMAGGAALQAAIKFAGVASAAVQDAAEEYYHELHVAAKSPNTIAKYSEIINNWMVRHGVERVLVSSIKTEQIEPFINTTENISLSTRRYRLTIIKVFFNHQIKKNRVLHNPCSPIGVRRHGLSQAQLIRKRTHAFTEEEYAKLLEAAGEMDFFWHFMLVFGRDSALRPVDIASLEVVNLEGDTVRLLMQKTGKEITLPITPRMRFALEARPPNGDACLFPFYKKVAQDTRNFRMQHEFLQLRKKAGVTRGSLRSLRKMGAMAEHADATRELTALIEREALRRTQAKLGHASNRTTSEFYLNR